MKHVTVTVTVIGKFTIEAEDQADYDAALAKHMDALGANFSVAHEHAEITEPLVPDRCSICGEALASADERANYQGGPHVWSIKCGRCGIMWCGKCDRRDHRCARE